MALIRPLTDADIDDVALVHVRTWQAGYAGIVPADYLAALDPVANAARRRGWPVRPGQHTLVAAQDGRVVGFVSFGPRRRDDETFDDEIGEVYAIYVEPGHWRGGIGRDLMDAAKLGLAGAGFRGLVLWVLEENDRGRRFYERMGLAPDGTRQFYTPNGSDARLPELRYATAL